MKPKFNIFLFVIVFLTISFAKAQEFDNSINSLFLVSKDLIHNGKNEIGQVQQSSNVQFLTNNNLIHISQIGFNNYSDVSGHNESSKIVIGQYGSNNYVEVYKKAPDLTQSVTQYGNNNYVSDFSLKYISIFIKSKIMFLKKIKRWNCLTNSTFLKVIS